MTDFVIRTCTFLRLRDTECGTAKDQEEEFAHIGYSMMAYCIALGTFWTYYYLLEDLVAHGLGRRNRICGNLEIEGRWEADMQWVVRRILHA